MGSEDYRWYVRRCHSSTAWVPFFLSDHHHREIIQKHIPVWAFKILNVTFISFMQSIILFLLAAPVYPILLSTQFQHDVGFSDVAFLAWQLSLVTSEWFSDQQQWGKIKEAFHFCNRV